MAWAERGVTRFLWKERQMRRECMWGEAALIVLAITSARLPCDHRVQGRAATKATEAAVAGPTP
jgi:hypothetical protein